MSQNQSNKRQKNAPPCPGCNVNFSTKKAFSNHVTKCHFIKMQALDFASHRINNSTALMSNTNINGITFRESLQAIQQHNVTMNNLDVYQQQYNDRRIQYDALVTKMGGPGTMAHQTLPNTNTDADTDADTEDDTSTDPAISSFAAAQDKDIDYPPSEDDNDKEDDSGSMMAAEEEGTNLGIDAIDNQDDMGNRGGEEDSSGKIQFAGTLSPALAVGVQLMNVLGKHTTDLSLFDGDVAKFVNELASTGHQFAKHVIPTRATIESTCEKTFNYKELKPKLIDVPVSSMSQDTITVPVFDVEAVIQKMLCNPSLMREEHFASNYDIFTGKPSEPVHKFDEIHTGEAWERARSHYCGDDTKAFPCGLVLFYDKSHCDRHGALALSPILFTCTFFNKAARAKDEFWDVLGYIPNLDYATSKTSDGKNTGAGAIAKCQDEHNCLFKALEGLKDLHDRGGMTLHVMGRDVLVKVWIHFIVGDIMGNNTLLGSYNSWNAKCPYRDCSCEAEDFIKPDNVCNFWSKAVIDHCKQTKNDTALQQMSKYNIANAFDNLPLSDTTDGIYRLTPPETMHAISAGIVKRMIEHVKKSLFGKKQCQDRMHQLHLLLSSTHTWQSERDLPRPSTRNPITETTKMQAHEVLGNLFLLLCAFHTDTGKAIHEMAGLSEQQRKDKIKCIKVILSLTKLLNRSNPRSIICNSQKLPKFITSHVIPLLQKAFPRDDGQGYKLPKVHSLTKFPYYIQLYGSAINFHGGFGESHLKRFMKHLSHFTQKRPSVFAEQVAKNHYRTELNKHSMKAISSQIGDVYEKVTDVRTSCDADGSGKRYITFSRRNNDQTLQMRNGEINVNNVTYNMKVKWLSNKAAGGNKLVDGLFGYIVARSFTSVGYYDKFEIECYTSLKLPNSPETLSDYESTRNTHTLYTINSTRERNDWCMICTQDLDTDESDPTFDKWAYTCPARIHGFFKVITPGVPTPILRQNYSNNLIRNQGRLDDTMYVVVHTNKDFMTWEKLEREFIVPVNLGDINNCTYIFPINRIVTPLYVFSNHGEVTTNASFFASIPARYWAFHLDYVLNDFTIPGNGGFSQKIVEEDM